MLHFTLSGLVDKANVAGATLFDKFVHRCGVSVFFHRPRTRFTSSLDLQLLVYLSASIWGLRISASSARAYQEDRWP